MPKPDTRIVKHRESGTVWELPADAKPAAGKRTAKLAEVADIADIAVYQSKTDGIIFLLDAGKVHSVSSVALGHAFMDGFMAGWKRSQADYEAEQLEDQGDVAE